MDTNLSDAHDMIYTLINKIEAGEPPPEMTIAGQTYLLRRPTGDAIQQAIADIFSQLQVDKDAALIKLLTATIKGERLIMVQQQNYMEGTFKYQFRFEEGELPYHPASIPDEELPIYSPDGSKRERSESVDNLAGLTLLGLIEAFDKPTKSLCGGIGLTYTRSDCAAEIRARLGITNTKGANSDAPAG